MFDFPGIIVYNINNMNGDRLQAFDLHVWIKRIRKMRKEDDFFRDFDVFIIAVVRLIALFFGIDIEKEEMTSGAKRFFRSRVDRFASSDVLPIRPLFRLPFRRYVLFLSVEPDFFA